MAFRSETARDEVFSGQSITDAFKGIFRMGGGWGNVSGPGLLMTRIIVSGTMTAVSVGLGVSTVFAIAYGTAALPFLVASCLGFSVGAYGFYRDALAKACITVERYPLLLRLHMHANFPGERFDLWEVGRVREVFRRERLGGGWRWRSMLLASWMTATPALDKIMELEEEAIVAAEVERQSWKE